MLKPTAHVLAVATAATALLLSVPAPAQAAVTRFEDPRGDVDHKIDVREVVVTNGQDNLRVTLHHRDLVGSWRYGESATLFVDLDPADRGPELVLSGGIMDGTDYLLTATEGFAPDTWGKPVCGDYSMRADWAGDVTRFRISNRCLRGAEEVRVAVVAAGQVPVNGPIVRDWLGEPRELFGPFDVR